MGVYTELVKRAEWDTSDWAIRGAGALGGGVLGWLIGRIANRKRKRNWLPWLLTMAGTTAGGLGADALDRFVLDKDSGTKEKGVGPDNPEYYKDMDLNELQAAVDRNKAGRKWSGGKADWASKGAKGGAGLGAVLGVFDTKTAWARRILGIEALKNKFNANNAIWSKLPMTDQITEMLRAGKLTPSEARMLARANDAGRIKIDPSTGQITDLSRAWVLPNTWKIWQHGSGSKAAAKDLLGRGGRRLGVMATDSAILSALGAGTGAGAKWLGNALMGVHTDTDAVYKAMSDALAGRTK